MRQIDQHQHDIVFTYSGHKFIIAEPGTLWCIRREFWFYSGDRIEKHVRRLKFNANEKILYVKNNEVCIQGDSNIIKLVGEYRKENQISFIEVLVSNNAGEQKTGWVAIDFSLNCSLTNTARNKRGIYIYNYYDFIPYEVYVKYEQKKYRR